MNGFFLMCLVLAGVGSANAHEVKTTQEGEPLRWVEMPVEYKMSKAGARDLKAWEALAAVQGAFDAWTGVNGAHLDFQFGGESGAGFGFDHENTVLWSRGRWGQWDFPETALAVTLTTYRREDGALLDADIVVNEARYRWSHDDETGENDLQNTLTHEVGHLAGLAHSAEAASTMFAHARRYEVSKRVLHADDEAGLRGIYSKAKIAERAQAVSRAADESSPRVAAQACAAASTEGGAGVLGFLFLLISVRRRR